MPAYRASRCDLNTWTLLRAITARRTRRMSSSLLPLNITPLITSIQPPLVGNGRSEITSCLVATGPIARAALAIAEAALAALTIARARAHVVATRTLALLVDASDDAPAANRNSRQF